MPTIKSIRTISFALYVSIGPVVWFPSVDIALIKTLLLITVCLSSLKYFSKDRIKGVGFFSIISIFLGICLFVNNRGDDVTLLVEGVIENFIIFNIGYNLYKDSLIKKKHLSLITTIIASLSLLTISNFLFTFPNWTSPIEMQRVEELTYAVGHKVDASALWSTGFSLSRTGWCNCLLLYLPPCYYLIDSRYKLRLSWTSTVCIWGSILVGGSKGAMLIGILMTLLFLLLKRKLSIKYLFGIALALVVITINKDTFIEHFRLNSEDITTGRHDQYKYIPMFLSQMGFWGTGYLSTRAMMQTYLGEDWSLHNTFAKCFIEYGYVVGLMIIGLTVSIYAKFIKTIKQGIEQLNQHQVYFYMVLLGGSLVCFAEPGAIFGALSWYAVWWATLGAFLVSNN